MIHLPGKNDRKRQKPPPARRLRRDSTVLFGYAVFLGLPPRFFGAGAGSGATGMATGALAAA